MSERTYDEIVSDFNRTIGTLIKRIERKSRSDIEVANLDRLRKRIQLLKRTMGLEALIAETAPFFSDYADPILERDEDFFINMDVRNEVKKNNVKISKQDEFIFSLTDSIKTYYRKSSKKEQDEIYEEVKTLLDCCLEHLLRD